MNCPNCGSADTRPSKKSRTADVMERVRGNGAFRCRTCRKRFYAPEPYSTGIKAAILSIRNQQPSGHISSRTKRRLVRKLVVIAIFAAAFALFWLFLRYITAEANPNRESNGLGNYFSSSAS